ncbi:hypothetical protein [Ferruginibacter sp.]|nr:hypothetical protein [Ferruginibacter sp.]
MRVIIFFTAVVISLNCLGQSKNYLVTSAGDSLFGNIKLKNGVFIVTNTTGIKEINADEVRWLNGDNFRGNVVVHCNLHLYNDNLYDLELGRISRVQMDTIMVLKEVYTTNKMNLYFGTDDYKTQYYFYKTPSDPLPVQLVVKYSLEGGLSSYLNNRPAYPAEKSRVHIEVEKSYVNQLKAVMGDCDMIPEATWELLDYRVYSLKKLIKKYNSCN